MARKVVFGCSPGQTESRDRKQNRTDATDYGNWTTFALLPIFLRNQTGLFSGRDIKRNPLLVEDLNPRRSEIDPSGIRISCNHRICRSQVSAAVVPVQFRNSESQDIGVLAGKD